ALTVHTPSKRHFGFLFTAYLIALLISAYSKSEVRPWLPQPFSYAVLLGVFGIQAFAGMAASAHDWLIPFSEAKETSAWLKQTGLDRRPLVIQPDAFGAAIVGYAQIPEVYYPACKCNGSFTVWKEGRDPDRIVTLEELQALYARAHQPPIVI